MFFLESIHADGDALTTAPVAAILGARHSVLVAVTAASCLSAFMSGVARRSWREGRARDNHRSLVSHLSSGLNPSWHRVVDDRRVIGRGGEFLFDAAARRGSERWIVVDDLLEIAIARIIRVRRRER